jgi:hypothetical protein
MKILRENNICSKFEPNSDGTYKVIVENDIETHGKIFQLKLDFPRAEVHIERNESTMLKQNEDGKLLEVIEAHYIDNTK